MPRSPHSNPHLTTLRRRVGQAPQQPGIYRWLDADGKVLYVGKAKNLRKRLASYVKKDAGANQGPWKRSFLAQIADVDMTVANTELEALLLETNLIKELRPKYNVLMKDDKNYLFIRVSVQEAFPRVETVRRLEQDGSKFFGPYLSSDRAYQTLDLLHEAFGYRACKQSVELANRDPKEPLHLNPCLESQIGRCNGLCAGTITQEEYRACIDRVIDFLKGHESEAKKILKENMLQAAKDRKFELATKLRNGLSMLEGETTAQLATDGSGEDSDIVGVAVLSNRAQVVILHRRNGRLIGESAFALAGQAESAGSVLEQFLPQFYDGREVPPVIIIPEETESLDALRQLLLTWRGSAVQLLVPERGKKTRFIDLAQKNALQKAKLAEAKWEAEERNTEGAMNDLESLLSLPGPPKRIEGYDISHTGGTETVGCMVVARDGKPANDQYRSFTIHTMKAGMIDDYRALKEVLTRRLKRLKDGSEAEEMQLASQGILLRKARKADQQNIAEIRSIMGLETDEEAYKEFTVATMEERIIALARLRLSKGESYELQSIWVEEEYRGGKFGQVLIRKVLKSVKRGRAYLMASPELEQYYAQIGFRYVIKPPSWLEESREAFCTEHPDFPELITMVWDAVQNKVDASLNALPDLLVIDGGKGQLSAVVEVLKAMELSIPVIGLAKREEDVFVPGNSFPIPFPKDSPAKFLLMRLRDEAHRFSNRHREKRAIKHTKQSVLDTIPGIGDETRIALLKKFGSVDVIVRASDEELAEMLSESQIGLLRNALE